MSSAYAPHALPLHHANSPQTQAGRVSSNNTIWCRNMKQRRQSRTRHGECQSSGHRPAASTQGLVGKPAGLCPFRQHWPHLERLPDLLGFVLRGTLRDAGEFVEDFRFAVRNLRRIVEDIDPADYACGCASPHVLFALEERRWSFPCKAADHPVDQQPVFVVELLFAECIC